MSENNPQCSVTSRDVTKYISSGAAIPPEQLQHIRGCSECAALVTRADQLSALLEMSALQATQREATLNDGSAAVDAAVLATHRRRQLLRLVVAAAIVVIAVGSWIMTGTLMHPRHRTAVWIAMMILFAGPLVVVYMTAGLEIIRETRFYKSMKGRELSGVCRGISDATGVPVWVVRMVFVATMFLKGTGLVAYLLLDLFLPIRPEDRGDLLRFRLMRWWQQRQRGAAEL